MNKADSQFLFDGSTNAIALSSQEMKQTEGEWIPFWNFGMYAYRAYNVYRYYYKPVNRSLRYGVFSSVYYNWR